MLDKALECPLLFVLGNHDFYGGSIANVRRQVAQVVAGATNLHYLTVSGLVRLSPKVCVIGHDGWGDARYGDFASSRLRLNDFRLIHELTGLTREGLGSKLRELGDEAAAHIERLLATALSHYESVLVITHVPPFTEISLYDGRPSPDGAPFFACKAVGDVILAAATAHPDRQITVICGHSHAAAEAQVAPNVRAIAGGARYGSPTLQTMLEFA